MSSLKLVYYPNPLLKQRSVEVSVFDADLRRFLDDMVETMYENNGIGLAAPQVGKLIRATVIDVGNDDGEPGEVLRLINPIIVERTGTLDYEEGCLSIPDIRGTVRRAENVIVDALNEHGKPVHIEASGLLAVCLQHEIDHLDGMLFIDRLSTLKRELLRGKLRELAEATQDENFE